ncbi:TlpA disulfide reductase family protein [Nocardioides sp. URHA0020]|uniref:TlpA disulfide reductase family protein n=1 Tax=Nocardioides sp. URHA0020 TaxID=1380392 RepID=UPI00068703C6|nr:TlpA disulfide reductase family protein [Nocardioides sp. URHA0020]
MTLRRTLLGVAVPLLLALSACTSLQGTGDKGFVTGDGAIRTIDAADRTDPVELAGTDLDGKPLDVADLHGKPVVVVVWGSWCGPCRGEAPDVVAAAKELGDGAQFVGINLRDSSTTSAQAYVRSFDVPYPSIYSPDGKAMLQFPGTLGPRTIPAFVVLDGDGRIAASIIGKLPSTQTLVDLVTDVEGDAEQSADG